VSDSESQAGAGGWLVVVSVGRWALGSGIFFLWAVSLLALSMRKTSRELFPYSRSVFRLFLRASGIRVITEGVEQIDPRVGYVYMFNHNSYLDHFFLASQVPGFLIGLEKASNFDIPIYGRVTRWWGNAAIIREDRAAAIDAIQAHQRILADGVSICVAPEGTRSRDGRVGPFKKGGFHMATRMKAPIVPVTMLGVPEANPHGRFLLRGGTVKLVFHSPIQTEGRHLEDLMKEVRDTICGAGLARRDEPQPAPSRSGAGPPS